MRALRGVAPHQRPLRLVQLGRLVEHRVRHCELADVVEQEAAGELGVARVLRDDRLGEQQAKRVDALDVTAGAAVLGLNRRGKHTDGGQVAVLELL
jgi:hypothetical protein